MPPLDPALKAKLAAMSGAFNQAKNDPRAQQDGPQYDTFDDGKYRGLLSAADVAESKTSGRLQINYQYTFLEGQYQGKIKHNSDGLDDPDRLVYVVRNLRALGANFDTLDITTLQDTLDTIVASKPIVDFTLKTGNKSDFQNLYINKVTSDLVDGAGAPSGESSAQPSSGNGSSSSQANNDTLFPIGTRVTFKGPDDSNVIGMVKRIDGASFYVISKGVEYQMNEEDMTKVA